jgi:dsRNA-specific ribonuclease
MADAATKMLAAMLEQGLDPESEEAQQQMNPESLKSLPEIEQFFKKDYRSMVEQWAEHQHKVDVKDLEWMNLKKEHSEIC